MSNKKSKRIKRYFKKHFGSGTKPAAIVEPIHKYDPPYKENYINPLHERFEELNKVCQSKLDKVYSGQVKALTTYFNDNTIMNFKCVACRLVFFGKISRLVGNDRDYHHVCGTDYGGKKVNNKRGSKTISKSIDGDKLVKTLDEMLDNGAPYRAIRQKTGVDTHIIEYYDKTLYKPKEG